jgi:hypothetical protein
MAHYAQLSPDNVVVSVFVGREDAVEGIDDWEIYYAPAGFTVKQTSYTGEYRAHYAGIGYSYDPGLDAFIPPRPYSSWTLNEGTADWDPPTPRPDGDYVWDENTTQWEEV